MALTALAKHIAMSLHICFKLELNQYIFPLLQTELSIATAIYKSYLASLCVNYSPSAEKPVLIDRVKDKMCQCGSDQN